MNKHQMEELLAKQDQSAQDISQIVWFLEDDKKNLKKVTVTTQDRVLPGVVQVNIGDDGKIGFLDELTSIHSFILFDEIQSIKLT